MLNELRPMIGNSPLASRLGSISSPLTPPVNWASDRPLMDEISASMVRMYLLGSFLKSLHWTPMARFFSGSQLGNPAEVLSSFAPSATRKPNVGPVWKLPSPRIWKSRALPVRVSGPAFSVADTEVKLRMAWLAVASGLKTMLSAVTTRKLPSFNSM